MQKCPFKKVSISKLKTFLNHPKYSVRPKKVLIPKRIQNTFLGDVFSKLIRMRDDIDRVKVKHALSQSLNRYSYDDIFKITQDIAEQSFSKPVTANLLNSFLATLPIYVLGTLLGYKPEQWQQLANDARNFSCSILSLDPSLSEISAQIESAERLYSQIEAQQGELFILFSQYAQQNQINDNSLLISNLMGLFFQVSDGTTGLIGLTLIDAQKRTGQAIVELVENVLNKTPPIKQTKRFIAQNNFDDEIIVPLSAQDGTLPFGYGEHCCPGEHIAKAMTCGAVEFILQQDIKDHYFEHYTWQVSANAQIPHFYDIKPEIL